MQKQLNFYAEYHRKCLSGFIHIRENFCDEYISGPKESFAGGVQVFSSHLHTEVNTKPSIVFLMASRLLTTQSTTQSWRWPYILNHSLRLTCGDKLYMSFWYSLVHTDSLRAYTVFIFFTLCIVIFDISFTSGVRNRFIFFSQTESVMILPTGLLLTSSYISNITHNLSLPKFFKLEDQMTIKHLVWCSFVVNGVVSIIMKNHYVGSLGPKWLNPWHTWNRKKKKNWRPNQPFSK